MDECGYMATRRLFKQELISYIISTSYSLHSVLMLTRDKKQPELRFNLKNSDKTSERKNNCHFSLLLSIISDRRKKPEH